MAHTDDAAPQPAAKWEKPTGPTCTIEHAGGFYFGLGRAASYQAVRRGTIPVVRDGERRLRAIVAKLDQMCGLR